MKNICLFFLFAAKLTAAAVLDGLRALDHPTISLAGDAAQTASPPTEKFSKFDGPFLSDPRERELLEAKVRGVWIAENFCDFDLVGSLRNYVIAKNDADILKWYFQKVNSMEQLISPPPKAACMGLLFDSILRLKDADSLKTVFKMAQVVMQNYGMRQSDVQRAIGVEFHSLFSDLLILRDNDFSEKVKTFRLSNVQPATHYDQNDVKIALDDIQNLAKSNPPALDDNTFYDYITSAYSHLGIIKLSGRKDVILRTYDAVKRIGTRNFSMSYLCEFFSGTGAELDILENELFDDKNKLGLYELRYLVHCIPPPENPRFARSARNILDLAAGVNDDGPWTTASLSPLIETGILRPFMTEQSPFQLLESGLSGPIWDLLKHLFHQDLVRDKRNQLAKCIPLTLHGINQNDISQWSRKVTGFALLALIDTLSTANRWKKTYYSANERQLTCISYASDAEKRQFSQFLFDFPDIARLANDKLLLLGLAQLYSGGHTRSTCNFYTSSILTLKDSPNSSSGQFLKQRDDIDLKSHTSAAPTYFDLSHVDHVHGRTAYLKQPGKAVKFPKLFPDNLQKGRGELIDELRMDLYLQSVESDLQLQSELPKNPILLSATISDDLRAALQPADAGYKLDLSTQLVLEFDAPVGYETPIHDAPTIAELEAASIKCLGDTAILAKKLGLVSVAPADLFHNLEDNRRYHWNVGIGLSYGIGFEAGRLDQWHKAIKHVNMGMNGLRDLKHYKFLDEIPRKTLDSRAGAMLTHLGNFLLCWMLSVGEWFKKHDFDDLESLQGVLSNGLSTFLEKFTERSKEECSKYVDTALQLDRLARQMKFFMTDEYVPAINGGIEFPDDIYGTEVDIEIRKPAKYWNEEKGWMRHEGQEDLGPYNGPFPITEMIRTIHIVTTTALNVAEI